MIIRYDKFNFIIRVIDHRWRLLFMKLEIFIQKPLTEPNTAVILENKPTDQPLGLLGALHGAAFAQVDLQCNLPVTQALLGESLPAVMTIRAQDRDLELGEGEDQYRVGFDVRDGRDLLVHLRPGASVQAPGRLPAGQEAVFTNDLHRLYRLDDAAQISVQGRLEAEGTTLVTPKVYVDIAPGAELQRLVVRGADARRRACALRSLNREKRDHLFLRMDDEDSGLCYGVFDLGRFIFVKAPVMQMDGHGQLHVLHVSGPNQFSHHVFTLDGAPVSQDVVAGDSSSVRLEADGAGGLRVTGAGPSIAPREPMVEPLPVRRSL